ncbi:hypothetical protein WH06_02415 [Aeromonas salmonicida subsp. salmonicida]|uniref:Uncharacterized protein n=2 Tax=Aeromonas salmonicida subsp. salmonicida TaxID=29491 RepID=A4SPE4_AERS4|nr:hypothetical protein [Aeromonas salmonicida]ABO90766.1 conserved hypothetical protein [Aeromonas salmonicida subsp. salmonicida A449]ASI22940.1 hypothetical protein CE456_09970 [Aeromonas salmonicida]ASI27254.1 hypothetical protein CE463_10000 [Aeromonas salmonicida]ASI31372.1 hypothetical protein CE462_08895 [Aeromonas salmonicida]ATD39574.1 hypothetical protein BHG40_17840 [Aeromonas salmonicida subsp. masoucida]
MSNNILSGSRELHLTPILLDLNALYHPPKRPLTALGVISAFMPLFGYGWQAMTQDPETHFRHELGKRINKHKTDEANLILMLQLAGMLDCHCLRITLPYALGEEQLATLQSRLPRWQITQTDQLLVAELPLPAAPASPQSDTSAS